MTNIYYNAPIKCEGGSYEQWESDPLSWDANGVLLNDPLTLTDAQKERLRLRENTNTGD